MKNKYEEPQIEIIIFNNENIITISNIGEPDMKGAKYETHFKN